MKTTSRFLALLSAVLVPAGASASPVNWTQAGVPICVEVDEQRNIQVDPLGAGGAIIVWQDDRGDNTDIYAQAIGANGTVLWDLNGEPICTEAGHQYLPQVTTDGAGGSILTWGDQRFGLADIFAQRINAAGTVLWTADGEAVCDTSGSQDEPQIVSDGAGGAILVWYDYRGSSADIYAQRIDSGGNALWISNGVSICTATGNQQKPQIISDGAGGAIITWVDYRAGSDDIYAARVDPSGGTPWTADGVAICTAGGTQQGVQIASDGAGGAIVTWEDYRSGGYDIYARRIDASGTPQWPADGVALCTASGTQKNAQIVSDGAGGAIVTWEDFRFGGYNPNVYAQRVDATGTAQWTADGATICDASGEQFDPRMVEDGAGGAIVSWYDIRSTPARIFEQRIDAGGAAQWGEDGIPICVGAGHQFFARIASDGEGGAIAAWVDRRAGPSESDVYAQRVDHRGSIAPVTAVEEPPPGVLGFMLRAFPNPTTTRGTRIGFVLAEPGRVSVQFFDARGRLVRTLFLGREGVGLRSTLWDGRDSGGRPVGPGTYFYRIRVNGRVVGSERVVVLK